MHGETVKLYEDVRCTGIRLVQRKDEGRSLVIVNTVLKLCFQVFIDHLNVCCLLNESSVCLFNIYASRTELDLFFGLHFSSPVGLIRTCPMFHNLIHTK